MNILLFIEYKIYCLFVLLKRLIRSEYGIPLRHSSNVSMLQLLLGQCVEKDRACFELLFCQERQSLSSIFRILSQEN